MLTVDGLGRCSRLPFAMAGLVVNNEFGYETGVYPDYPRPPLLKDDRTPTETSSPPPIMAAMTIVQDPTLSQILPKTFLHGYSSASYQIEGGSQEDGRGPSVWDDALKNSKDNGNDAVDSYHMWQEDIELLKKYGATAYRFSISWSRVIPLGGKDDPVNQKGLDYYSNLIDGLLAANITPFITLHHWDLPLELERRYNGWLATDSQKESLFQDFQNYARILFRTYGDRVKHWVTLNEPHIYTMYSAIVLKRATFNTEVDMWKQGNNLIIGHARVVDLYRREFKSSQKGTIGISLNCDWAEPIDSSSDAKAASLQISDLTLGWFADPIFLGKHNETVKRIAGPALDDFTQEEWSLIYGSSEFFGFNHYGTRYSTGKSLSSPNTLELFFGRAEQVTEDLHGKPIGRRGHHGHPYNVPWGFRKLLVFIHQKWTSAAASGNAIPIYVTENGWATEDEAKKTLEEILNDTERQEYYAGYLEAMLRAIKEDGILIEGYFGWSLLEWVNEYAKSRSVGRLANPLSSLIILAPATSSGLKASNLDSV
ncbi:hypothetical protein FRB94_007380 [Tulasnella sp. JGI-2019a]|nr:hypothetical protein FRB94_007380 [Tulasnella sp. JGI-2019a]KAG9029114.1 hypothetical protein FRB95_005657 [Tulasnella sp. JGI-2019a]